MLSAFTARPIIELKQRDKSKIETILAYGDRVLVGLNTGSLRVYRVNELPPPPPPPKPTNGASHPAGTAAAGTSTDGSVAADSRPASSSAPASAPTPSPSPAPTAGATTAPPAAPAVKPTDLLRELEKFSTRSIEQLAIIKEANTLVSLSNYAVSLHDLQTFEPIEAPLARTKNASCFAVTSNIVKEPATGIPEIISRLAVAVKRRLLLWSWHESELSPDVTEVVLAESVRTLTWASASKLVVGMNAGYVMVDVLTGGMEDIVGSAIGGAAGGQGSRFGAYSSAGMGYMGLGGYMPKPLAAKLADGEMLLAKDINSLFITDSGKPIDKRQIPWQSAPDSIGYSYPYILALQPPAKGSLEVRNPDTLSLLQVVALPGAAQLHFPPPTVSLAHAGKGFHISSDRCVWKMDATDYDSQVDELVAQARYDEAISILTMLEDALLKNKTQTLREVKMKKAEMLFKQRKYLESMDLFNEEDVHAPPERVLRFFPKSIAGDLSAPEEKETDSDHEGQPNGKANGEGKALPTKIEVPKPEPAVIEAASPSKGGGGGFTKMLLGHRKINAETASIASSRKGADSEDAASIKGKPVEDQTLEGKELVSAVEALNSYLAGTRARLQRVIDPTTGKLKQKKSETEDALDSLLLRPPRNESDQELEKDLRKTFTIVDTTMFRVLMLIRPTLASSLFRIPNFCDPDVVNERLVEHNRYNELVDFFYGKKLHRPALELLKKFGSGPEPDEAAPLLHGPQRTVVYLQSLPPEMIDLILEFSEWTLRADPQLGMEIFVADSENAETLPRDRVVAFLDGIDIDLEIRYLEHIIAEWNDLTPDFHNRLVELFVRRLREKASGARDEDQDEQWRDAMQRLVRFLKESRQYSLSRAFGLIPRDDPLFYEAQAVVLSNMGQHKQALEIYVFKMKDFAKAEEYCNRVYKSQDSSLPAPAQLRQAASPTDDPDEAAPSIYHTLLSLYLTPPSPNEPNLGPALDLLSKHGSRLPASSTLRLIPDTLPVAELESYFRGRMRAANSIFNESRIETGLRQTALLASQALLLLGDGIPGGQGGRNRRVVISEERVCGVCHKRLGGSVVAVLPDSAVVHYGCLNRAGASTGTSLGTSVGGIGRSDGSVRGSSAGRSSLSGGGY